MSIIWAIVLGVIGGLLEFPIRQLEVKRAGGRLVYWILLGRYVIGAHMIMLAWLSWFKPSEWRRQIERAYGLLTPMGLAVVVTFFFNRRLHEME